MKPKNIIFNFILVLLTFSLYAQDDPGWQWAQRGGSSAPIGGSQRFDYGMERIVDIAIDSNNNYYYLAEVGGYTFNLGDMEFDSYNSNSDKKDIFIFSTNAEGNYKWGKVIGGEATERASSLGLDDNENVYVSGNVFNFINSIPVHFDTDTIMDPVNNFSDMGPENKSAFIIKYNSEGVYQWLRMPGDENAPQSSDGEAGFGYSNAHILNTVIDEDGTTHSLMLMAPGTFFDGQLVVEDGNRINAIVTYDSEGSLIDFFTLNMKPKFPAPLGVAFYKYQLAYDANLDRYYIADTYRDTPDPDDPLSINGYGAETVDKGFYLAALNNQGEVLWYQENHKIGSYRLGDVQLDGMGNVYLTGWASANSGADSFAGYVFDPEGSGSGKQDPFLVKLDSDGNLLWGTNPEVYSPFPGQSIVINGDNVYLGLGMLHNTWGNIDIPGFANQGLIPDIAIMRFDAQTGEAQEVIRDQNTPTQDAIMAMALDNNGDLITGGYFGSDLFSGTDLHLNDNATDSDFFIAKYHTGTGLSVEGQTAITMKVYPNPTTGLLTLQSEIGLGSYKLFDLRGRTIKQGGLETNRVDLSGIENGLYILRVQDLKGGVQNLKVVKE